MYVCVYPTKTSSIEHFLTPAHRYLTDITPLCISVVPWLCINCSIAPEVCELPVQNSCPQEFCTPWCTLVTIAQSAVCPKPVSCCSVMVELRVRVSKAAVMVMETAFGCIAFTQVHTRCLITVIVMTLGCHFKALDLRCQVTWNTRLGLNTS